MKKRELSIATAFNYEIPIYEQIPLIAKAGFSHISIGENEKHSNYTDIIARKAIKDLLHKFSLKIDTLHGPRLDKPNALENLIQVCQAANDLAAPIIVLHCSSFEFDDIEFDSRYINRKFAIYRVLL